MNASLSRLRVRTVLFGIGYLFRHPQKFIPRLMLRLHQFRDPDYPSIAPGAVDFIDAELSRGTAIVGEWGSGRSTLWLAKRCATLVSVEHDPEWQRLISSILKERGCSHASVILAEEKSSVYPSAIFSTGVTSFDLFLIDGRLRGECAAVAIKAIKKGGIVVLDDSNRSEYSDFIKILGKEIHKFTGHARQTSIFRIE